MNENEVHKRVSEAERYLQKIDDMYNKTPLKLLPLWFIWKEFANSNCKWGQ